MLKSFQKNSQVFCLGLRKDRFIRLTMSSEIWSYLVFLSRCPVLIHNHKISRVSTNWGAYILCTYIRTLLSQSQWTVSTLQLMWKLWISDVKEDNFTIVCQFYNFNSNHFPAKAWCIVGWMLDGISLCIFFNRPSFFWLGSLSSTWIYLFCGVI